MRQTIDLKGFGEFSDAVTHSLYLYGKKEKKRRREEVLNRVRHCVTASQPARMFSE
jgi:hypothetical protein